MELTEDLILFATIFMPDTWASRRRVESSDTRFVHYTTAEAALGILRDEKVWLRNATCMNDYMEVEHGLDCLDRAYQSENGIRLRKLMDGLFAGFMVGFEERFNSWVPTIRNDTYILCLSEHDDREDQLGRLSMWRAYGQSTGVAVVINNGPLVRPSDALGAYSMPVTYLDGDEVETWIGKLADAVEKNLDFLQTREATEIAGWLFETFRYAAVCTKHPGFREEREWRVVFSPAMHRKDRLEEEIRAINGVPQPIWKLPFKNFPEEGLYDLDIPKLVDRIIIGPSDYGFAQYDAFVSELERLGFEDLADSVFVSRIPIQ